MENEVFQTLEKVMSRLCKSVNKLINENSQNITIGSIVSSGFSITLRNRVLQNTFQNEMYGNFVMYQPGLQNPLFQPYNYFLKNLLKK